MFYENNLLTKKSASKSLKITFSPKINTLIDDMSLPQNVAVVSFNTDCSSGSLKGFGGIENFILTDQTNGVSYPLQLANVIFTKGWYFAKRDYENAVDDHRIVLLGSDGYLYQISVKNARNGLSKINGFTFDQSAYAVNYKLDEEDVLLISSATNYLTVFDGDNAPYELTDAPKSVSMAVHYERLFATSGDNVLWFSDDLDPTNWNISLEQAGYLEFADERGKLLKLISFDDYLYLFRQYGITRLAAYASQEDFTVTQLYTAGSNICPETVKTCGNKILFLAGDGIYTFDGLSATEICREISGLLQGVDNSTACAGYKSGKYYLACRLNYGEKGANSGFENEIVELSEESENGNNSGESGNNSLICIDTITGEYTISRGFNVLSFAETYKADGADLAFFLSGEQRVGRWCNSGQVFDETMDKNHICPETDLGYADRKKELLFLYVNTQEDVTVRIKTDDAWKSYSVRGKSGYQRIYIKSQGEIVQLAFSSNCQKMKVRPCFILFKVY